MSLYQRKLGKKPAKIDHRTLKLANYKLDNLTVPNTCDYTNMVTNLGTMLNDEIGDCTIAAIGHLIQLWTAQNGSQSIIPNSDILSLYEKVTGYNPNEPNTDNGAVEIDVLNYWRSNPIDNNQLYAYVSINPKDIEEIKQAIYYFNGAYIGVELPLSVQDEPEWKFQNLEGNNAPGSWGGHAIPLVAYDDSTFTCITWGAFLKMDYNFLTNYCEEAYALLSPDIINNKSGKTIEGFNLVQLQTDLGLIS